MTTTFVRRVELVAALALSLIVLVVIGVRMCHAGPLWRDECAVVQMASLPSLDAIWKNFPHEAFPPPFPLLIRGWIKLFGTAPLGSAGTDLQFQSL